MEKTIYNRTLEKDNRANGCRRPSKIAVAYNILSKKCVTKHHLQQIYDKVQPSILFETSIKICVVNGLCFDIKMELQGTQKNNEIDTRLQQNHHFRPHLQQEIEGDNRVTTELGCPQKHHIKS